MHYIIFAAFAFPMFMIFLVLLDRESVKREAAEKEERRKNPLKLFWSDWDHVDTFTRVYPADLKEWQILEDKGGQLLAVTKIDRKKGIVCLADTAENKIHLTYEEFLKRHFTLVI